METKLSEEFKRAVALRDAGDFQAAVEILEPLAKERPDSVRVLVTLGHALWEMERLEEAVDVFKRGTVLAPTYEPVSLGLFHCLWKMGKKVEALDEVRRFMTVADSEDYRNIVREINGKY